MPHQHHHFTGPGFCYTERQTTLSYSATLRLIASLALYVRMVMSVGITHHHPYVLFKRWPHSLRVPLPALHYVHLLGLSFLYHFFLLRFSDSACLCHPPVIVFLNSLPSVSHRIPLPSSILTPFSPSHYLPWSI